MDQPLNVVWILVDSIRTYRTDADLRGRLPVFETFERQSVSFQTCVTTAPSTIMSITGMMTGLPAYFLARNYDDFRFDPSSYTCLSSILQEHGYATYAFLRGAETREKFQHLLQMAPRKYWGPSLRHGLKWTNEDLVDVLRNVLDDRPPRPSFFFFHFNPQTRNEKREILVDPSVSEHVEEAWRALELAGFNSDNTIYVMCSDHGFPDPNTGLTSEWEEKHRLTHDLVLTDDNILIPLYIRFPGVEPSTITIPVGSLDIFPTLLDLLDLPERLEIEESIDGRSLVPLIRGQEAPELENRLFRSDNRLMLQTGRCTAIRGKDWKYIRFHDDHRLPNQHEADESSEVLLDLRTDPQEERNVLLSPTLGDEAAEVLERYREALKRYELRALTHQITRLVARLRSTGWEETQTGRTISLVFEPDTAAYKAIGQQAFRAAFPRARLISISHESNDAPGDNSASDIEYRLHEGGSLSVIGEVAPDSPDLAVVFVQNPSAPITRDLLKFARSIGASRTRVIDCNFTAYRSDRYWHFRLKALVQSIPHILAEPELLLRRFKTGVRLVNRQIMQKLKLYERWQGPENSRDA